MRSIYGGSNFFLFSLEPGLTFEEKSTEMVPGSKIFDRDRVPFLAGGCHHPNPNSN